MENIEEHFDEKFDTSQNVESGTVKKGVRTKYISFDVITDGEYPGRFSMLELAAVVVDKNITKTFSVKISPISDEYQAISYDKYGISREEFENDPDILSPEDAMYEFVQWVDSIANGRNLVFLSDNPAFDWQFVNYYLHEYYGNNPYSNSVRRVGDLWSGRTLNMLDTRWKSQRKNGYGYNALNIAMGNANIIRNMFMSGMKF